MEIGETIGSDYLEEKRDVDSKFAKESPQLQRSRRKFAEEIKREKSRFTEEERTKKLSKIKQIMKNRIDSSSHKREVVAKNTFRHFSNGEDVQVQSAKVTALAQKLKAQLEGKGPIG